MFGKQLMRRHVSLFKKMANNVTYSPRNIKVNLKIVKSTLFKRVLTDVSVMLASSGYKY